MSPTLAFHNVAHIELGDIRRLPATEDREQFWVRDITFIDTEGSCYSFSVYSDVGEDALELQTPQKCDWCFRMIRPGSKHGDQVCVFDTRKEQT